MNISDDYDREEWGAPAPYFPDQKEERTMTRPEITATTPGAAWHTARRVSRTFTPESFMILAENGEELASLSFTGADEEAVATLISQAPTLAAENTRLRAALEDFMAATHLTAMEPLRNRARVALSIQTF